MNMSAGEKRPDGRLPLLFVEEESLVRVVGCGSFGSAAVQCLSETYADGNVSERLVWIPELSTNTPLRHTN